MSNQILALRDHLLTEKVTCVVMEATGDYWSRTSTCSKTRCQ